MPEVETEEIAAPPAEVPPAVPTPAAALVAPRRTLGETLRSWFDADATGVDDLPPGAPDRVDLVRILPFLALHAAVLFVFVVGWSPVAVLTAIALYLVRMFAITGFYHRYFSHRAFRLGRTAQFLAAVLGASAVQRGPLWWAAHHRNHHAYSDQPEDVHSPRQYGFLWSHMLWFCSKRNFRTHLSRVGDLTKFPELRWLDRFDIAVPAALGAATWAAGALLARFAPSLGTSGPQMFVWGFIVSTIFLFHGTFVINSLAHVWGSRRFETGDDSRNNPVLALITLGEGWHNNHHRYMSAARQGFYWWEYDITFYVLKALSLVGVVHDLRPVPEAVLEEGRKARIERAA